MCSSVGGFLIYLVYISGVMGSIERLELMMPRYALRGGDVVLRCDHSVPPEQLHKVEWQKGGTKIFQYIKGRNPPFRSFPTAGAVLNKAHSNQKQIQLSKLDFPASGSYSCVVSMETPIFSKDSEIHDLTVIESQNADPIIRFNKESYGVGEILEANCTTAPARPPPHVTWLINNEKVDDSMTKLFTNGRVLGQGYFEQTAASTKQLAIEVSDLHAGEDGFLILTCISTIPAYVSYNEQYADIRNRSVNIMIEVTEEAAEAAGVTNNTSCSDVLIESFLTTSSLFLITICLS